MSAPALAGWRFRTSSNDCCTRIYETRIEDTIHFLEEYRRLGVLDICVWNVSSCIVWEAWRLERSFFSRQDLVNILHDMGWAF